MEQEKSLEVCGIIAGVLVADDHVHPDEADFLKRVQARFGVPEDKVVEPIGHEEAVAKLRELPAELRKETLELLVEGAAADGRVEIGERIFLDAVAKELGTSQEDLDAMVKKALDAVGG